MRLSTILFEGLEQAAIEVDQGLALVDDLNRVFHTSWPITLWEILQENKLDQLKTWYDGLNNQNLESLQQISQTYSRPHFAPIFRRPGKIWGIGLNYPAHAVDLSTELPLEIPASFIKATSTLIGPGEEIKLPDLSQKVTGEAELGLVIGKKVQQGQDHVGLDVLAGFCSIIDMTAEDILKKDPRYLTLSKNFDSFFSLGSQLITLDEIENTGELRIQTVKNNQPVVENYVKNMTFSPAELLTFHSKVMTLEPGDIISSGTPGAVQLKDGDIIECRIDGFRSLQNPVTDLKRKT